MIITLVGSLMPGGPARQTRPATPRGRAVGTCLLLVLALAQLPGRSARADAITLAWSRSADPTVVGYNLYRGAVSRTYTTVVAVGTVTNTAFPGLMPGVRYFFAATAVNRAGLESPFSNEVSYQIPVQGTAIATGVLTSSANPALPGQAVTFSLFLSAAAHGTASPTGTAQLLIDGVDAGPPVPLSSSAAAFTTTGLAHGEHTVVANYSGDTNFAAASIPLGSPEVIDSPPVPLPATLYGLPSGGRVAIADLLTNVEDADGDLITLVGVSPVSAEGGAVTIAGQWILYAPPPGSSNRTDAFSYQVTDGLTAPVTGAVIVTAQTNAPTMVSLVILNFGDGTLGIGGEGAPGETYTIQYTASPLPSTKWITLGTATADAEGAFLLIETAVPGLRLYRAVGP